MGDEALSLDGLKLEDKAPLWTEEEVEAGKETKKLLEADEKFDNKYISKRELWLCVVKCWHTWPMAFMGLVSHHAMAPHHPVGW